MKLLALSLVTALGSAAALVQTGVLPCPCELVARCSAEGAPASRAEGTVACPAGSAACSEQGARLAGDYVDARDCTVFGGACHVNGESTSQGRSALLAWRLDAGGVVVAAVEGESNLAPPNGGPVAQRRAVLFVDGVADDLVERLAASAGLEVVARHATRAIWQRDGDAFHVGIEGVVDLSGSALADRSCCRMPNLLWYRPLASQAVAAPVVGNPTRCRFAGSDGLEPWAYEGANSALLGRFELAVEAAPAAS